MKTLLTFAAVLCFAAVPAYSADGQLSQSSLARLGLAGMTSLSDSQGLEVRGLGVMQAMHMEDGYGSQDEYGNHEKDKHQRDEHKHHENKHYEHEHHDQKHHDNHQHIFKCDFHMKAHCDFGSLCRTHCGKAG